MTTKKIDSKNLFIISGPSGVGEDTIIIELAKKININKIVSTTTRKQRTEEIGKKTYYFISKDEFKKEIKNNNFFEYAQEYNDNYYGVTNKELNRVINSSKIGIWKIEYKGVITAKKKFKKIIAILISAPLDVSEKRIRKRGNVSEKCIKERLIYTKEWEKYKNIYDYEVVNEEGKLNKAVDEVYNIIKNNIKF